MQGNVLLNLFLMIYQVLFRLLGIIIPKNKKMIIFESFHGKQYSDNPRALYEYMVKKHPDYTLIWSADRRHLDLFSLRNIPHVKRLSIKWLWYMNRSKFWIVNSRLPLWLPKPSSITYVQTWHGTPLKRLAADMEQVLIPGMDTNSYKRDFLYEASKWDYLISPNSYSTKIFQRAFAFDKEIIESGYPRNDYLITHDYPENISQLKDKIGIPNDKKVILYAPTWRDNEFYGKGQYKFSIQMDLEKLRNEFGNEYIILLRMHYLIAENLDINEYEGFVYDLSKYEDIRDLYLISDILITDYSSVFFDYANLKRPMIFFVYDIDNYRDNLRGFYFDFETNAPGPLVKTTGEIIDVINQLEFDRMYSLDSMEKFYQKFCSLENGHSCERVVSQILDAD